MARRSSDRVFRQVHRLLKLGTVGGTSDAQLLDWFVSERGEVAEAAFEELMIRHGPMVFRVCRRVLRDTEDAEDAFQATFVILAHRARSIRRHGSVASWLFGVAHRVASRAKNDAARRRARDLQVTVQTPESYLPATENHDWATLHEEIRRLPESLRAPVALCYLEGLTYEAAAQQLSLPEGTVRGRLARARERLRRRLVARGVTVPAGLLVAGTAGQVQAAIPASLAHSTVRIALGFMAGRTARVLGRGVRNAMMLNHLKVVTALSVVGFVASYCAWNAFAGLIDDNGQADAGPVVARTPAQVAASGPVSQTTAPVARYRLNGTVRVERTGEPVGGAKLQIHSGDIFEFPNPDHTIVETGADGLFVVDLPAGPVQVQLAEPPVGYYWVLGRPGSVDSLAVGPLEPVVHREYRARKGTIWDFQLTRGPDRKPFPGFVSGNSTRLQELFQAHADEAGQTHMALPSDAHDVVLYVRESSWESSRLETGHLFLRLQWQPNFRPDELHSISPLDGGVRGFRLTDANEKTATLHAATQIEPVNDNGRLVIRVAVPGRDSKDFGAVTGQVLDEKGRPIAGASVGLAATRNRVSHALRHQSTTDARGWFRLRDIPRRTIDREPSKFQIVVVKKGYAGFVSPPLTLKDGTTEKFEVVDPIRLEPGVTISGIVVDHRGRPVAGARVRTNRPVPHAGLAENIPTVRADENGRFTIDDLQRGMTLLTAYDGILIASPRYFRVGSSQSALLQLPEPRIDRDAPKKAVGAIRAAPAGPSRPRMASGTLVRRPRAQSCRSSG